MVIRKGVDWGWDADVPPGIEVCASDAGAAVAVAAALAEQRQASITLLGGDLWRTVGGIDGQPASGASRCLPVDLGFVELDDRPEVPFIAHVVARRFGWQGEGCVVMNAAWVGDLYLGPRAHPNDDLLDVTIGSIPLNQRLEARRRARSGMHLPHPGLTMTRSSRQTVELKRPTPIAIDGKPVGKARRMTLRLVPDAALLYV